MIAALIAVAIFLASLTTEATAVAYVKGIAAISRAFTSLCWAVIYIHAWFFMVIHGRSEK